VPPSSSLDGSRLVLLRLVLLRLVLLLLCLLLPSSLALPLLALEIDLDGDELGCMGAMRAGNQWSPWSRFIGIVQGTLPKTDDPEATRPFPILQVRIPTEEDRNRLQEALGVLEEELRRSVRFVVGKRRLEGIDR
jgi:hypothetical protein